MVESTSTGGEAEPGAREWNAVFSALSHHWRRFVVRSLLAERDRQSRMDLAVTIANRPVTRGEESGLETVRSQLYHVHLPKLERAALVSHDRGDGTVDLGCNAALAEPILTRLEGDAARTA